MLFLVFPCQSPLFPSFQHRQAWLPMHNSSGTRHTTTSSNSPAKGAAAAGASRSKGRRPRGAGRGGTGLAGRHPLLPPPGLSLPAPAAPARPQQVATTQQRAASLAAPPPADPARPQQAATTPTQAPSPPRPGWGVHLHATAQVWARRCRPGAGDGAPADGPPSLCDGPAPVGVRCVGRQRGRPGAGGRQRC